jgi:hypothetical protein
VHERTDECEVFQFGPLRLVPARRLLLAGENRIELGSRAFDILALLVRRRGEVVSRRRILEHVWPDLIVDESNLRVQNTCPSSCLELRERRINSHHECAGTRICIHRSRTVHLLFGDARSKHDDPFNTAR